MNLRSIPWWTIVAGGALFLAACRGMAQGGGSYLTKHSVFIDGDESDWLSQPAAEEMEDLAIKIATDLGYTAAAESLDGLRVHLKPEGWYCNGPTGPLCAGATRQDLDVCPSNGDPENPEIYLAPTGFCEYQSQYVHELMHAIMTLHGAHDSDHLLGVWGNIDAARRELYLKRCFA